MLSDIDFSKKTLDTKVYKNEIKLLEEKLKNLQLEISKLGIPVIIAFDGFSASGKGTQMKRLVYPLDPRLFNVYPMSKTNEEIVMRPFLWDFFNKTPEKGRMAIFDRSWCRNLFPDKLKQWSLNEKEKKNFLKDVKSFEKILSDDGTVIIKLFLYISKEQQKSRYKDLIRNPDTAWRVNQNEWKNYEQYKEVFEQMIEETSTEENPWCVIEADDKKYATIKIFKTIIERIEEEINKVTASKKAKKSSFTSTNKTILQSTTFSSAVSDSEYKESIKGYQELMQKLSNKLYSQRQSVVIVYEGWDAAGKGGNIKRLTEDLDPRGYEVVPVAAPTKEELAHNYLWRFYKKIPKDGHIAIFDRSWYGRVLVERVEGFSDINTWSRAYEEINNTEKHWNNHGIIFFKFWLHIDKEEQLKRFEARQEDIRKQHKITDEDWRNREKWDLYLNAVNDMIDRTSTDYAPWTVIESNDKKFARMKTLKIVTDELSKKLL